jgi:3-phosphoshikimate 1-carboxyvinyltransferase
MIFSTRESTLSGSVRIPGSKSHTIRGLILGLLADGESILRMPLESSDTRSCRTLVRALGGDVDDTSPDLWKIQGTAASPRIPDNVVDVGNSGTTLYMGMGTACLIEGMTILTGDEQIRRRPAGALMKSLEDLGGGARSTRDNGMPPLVMEGRLRGGKTGLESVTSQYLSSLLLAAPFGHGESEIVLTLLNEKPYIDMTLTWMDACGLTWTADGYERFRVPGGQTLSSFDREVAADFSSATFFLVAAAVTGSSLRLEGLDYSDSQGDKRVVDILSEMGAAVEIGENHIHIRGGELSGGVFDLNDIPDALPALAVAAASARGTTRLVNVPQARVKETDRIAVMAGELGKLGVETEELPDGLVIRGGEMKGAEVDGHGDHRVVMALSVAGLAAGGETRVSTAEAAAVTFPDFYERMLDCSARIEYIVEKGVES